MIPRVLTLGGLDPSGGAGLTADAQTLARFGATALPVATALTVQNRHGVWRVEPVAADLLHEMLEAAVGDGPVHALKTGLLAAPDQAAQIAFALADLTVPVVVDPVLSAGAGGWSADEDLVAAIRRALVPRATVVTPNLPELDRLTAGDGPEALLDAGCNAVLVKGGHGRGERIVDRLVTPRGSREFEHRRLPVGTVHGTGCALASALAARLAHGDGLEEGCAAAIEHVQRLLRAHVR